MNNFTEYLWFNLAPSNIIFVNSHITLQAFVKALAVARARPGGTFVGVDAEWSAFEKPLKNCSLLQLALHNEVYVFDMLALSPSPFSGKPAKDISLSEQGRAVLSALFHDPTIVKAGWAFNSSDLKVLRSSFQGFFGEAFNKPRGILDLQKLTKEYKADFGLQVQIESLSKCAEYFLGRKLNKFEQLSDWNYRPLKLSQLTYAALDSHVLLALLDAVMLTLGVSSPPTQTLVYYPPHVQQHPLGITVRQDLLATEGDQAVDSKNGRWEAADCWQSFIR